MIIDARGLSCPQPVVLTKKALEKANDLTVIVDNSTAEQNVSRLAEGHGMEVSVDKKGDGIYLRLTRPADQSLGGKVPLLPDYVAGREGDDLLLRNYQGRTFRYPDPGGTIGADR